MVLAVPNTFVPGNLIASAETNANNDAIELFVNTTQVHDGINGAKIQDPSWNKMDLGADAISIGLVRHSDLIWETSAALSTDGGGSWTTGKGYGQISSEDVAITSGATMISTQKSGGSTAFSTDSGTTVQASSTQPANITQGVCVSLANTTVGVMGGKAGAGVVIWLTSNSGDDWTQATTGPSGVGAFAVVSIAMASATVGYAIDTNGNIWKTTDAGVNWTDTTDNTIGTSTHMIAVSTDEILFMDYQQAELIKYVNSTNTVTVLLTFDMQGTTSAVSNIVNATNGNYYFIFATGRSSGGIDNSNMVIFRYDGSNIAMKSLGMASDSNPTVNMRITAEAFASFPTLIEGAANILHFNLGGRIMDIDVVGDV